MPQSRISRRAAGAAAAGSAVGGIILALPQPMVFGEVALAPLPQQITHRSGCSHRY